MKSEETKNMRDKYEREKMGLLKQVYHLERKYKIIEDRLDTANGEKDKNYERYERDREHLKELLREQEQKTVDMVV